MKARAGKKHVVLVRRSAAHLQGVEIVENVLLQLQETSIVERSTPLERSGVRRLCEAGVPNFTMKQQKW